jgi:hypothetical protein
VMGAPRFLGAVAGRTGAHPHRLAALLERPPP